MDLLQQYNACLEEVREGLAKHKSEWSEIAEELDYSYEFISRLGLGSYGSKPTIERLTTIRDHLAKRSHPGKNGKRRATA